MAQPYTWIEIDTLTLSHNVRTIRDYIGEGIRLLAVVKANAYGHGFSFATEAFWRAGIDGFVVTSVDDALVLVDKYPKTPTLLLTPPAAVDLPRLIQKGVRLAGVSREYIDLIKNVAVRYDETAHIHLEVETGMHRFGVRPQEVHQILLDCNPKHVKVEALFTHFYAATNDSAVESQLMKMQQLLFDLQQADVPLPWLHVASGGAIGTSDLHKDDVLCDGVRCGRILYGEKWQNITTRPALTWKTKVVELYSVKADETVSYDATYTTDRDKTIAVLPVGYFDGIDRSVSNKGCVLIQGKRCPIVGRVCMNNIMVDVSPVMRPQVGDEVVLLGSQSGESILPAEHAEWADTIDYEILARLPHHIPRIKIK